MKAEKQTDKVKKQIKSFDFLDADYKTKTKDAYVSLKTNEFKIVKEVYGDTPREIRRRAREERYQ